MSAIFTKKLFIIAYIYQKHGAGCAGLSLVGLADSEQVGLLHDSHELLLANLSVAVSVGFVDHFLDLLVSHIFAELLGDPLQVFEGDFASLVIVEKSEGLEHLLFGVSLRHLLGHHVQKFWEVDHSAAVTVGVGDHLSDFLLLGLEPESSHGDLQFFGVDGPAAVGVEKIEGLFDFLFLLLGQLRSLLGSSEGRLFIIGCHFEFMMLGKFEFIYL